MWWRNDASETAVCCTSSAGPVAVAVAALAMVMSLRSDLGIIEYRSRWGNQKWQKTKNGMDQINVE